MKRAMKKLALTVSMLTLLGAASGGTAAYAQVNDQRVNQLQEQVRDLTGKLEDLNFQILKMQEDARKIQEDNDFRFQELEKKKKADAGTETSTKTAAADNAAASGTAAKDQRQASHTGGAVSANNDNSTQEDASDLLPAQSAQAGDLVPAQSAPAGDLSPAKHASTGDLLSEQNTAADLRPSQDVVAGNSAASVATDGQSSGNQASQAPRALGSIRFDSSGNVIGGSLNEDAPTEQIASLPQTDNPNELYQGAYQFILAGDYRAAEVAFQSHIDRYPADPMTSDARYWLGEALYGQERYAEAATVFIDNQRDFPDSKRGAENMLKLGMAMAKLNDRDVACATLLKVSSRFPSAAPAVLKRADDERKLNHC